MNNHWLAQELVSTGDFKFTRLADIQRAAGKFGGAEIAFAAIFTLHLELVLAHVHHFNGLITGEGAGVAEEENFLPGLV